MHRPELKLVGQSPRTRSGPSWVKPLLLTLPALAVAAQATAIGVDGVRRPVETKQVAQDALRMALARGNEDPEVRATMVGLRTTMGRRPLDSRTRVIYASLLVGLSRRMDDTRAAAFHAVRAAELSPVTVPIVQLAVRVLVRTGDRDRATELIREMFVYDPSPAAALLAEVEQLLFSEQAASSLPDTPSAWSAWTRELRRRDRRKDADDWVRRSHERWPSDPEILRLRAQLATRHGEWELLGRLFPEGQRLDDGPRSAPLLLYRARVRIRRGDRQAARRDIERALRLDGERLSVRILAGQTFEELGEYDLTRRQWSRALFGLNRNQTATRRTILTLLARLEDRHGRPTTALRLWESVLEVAPDDVEAIRRRDDLTGFQR